MPEFEWLLSRLTDPRSLLDIAVVSLLIYWVLWVAKGTRAALLIRGVVIGAALIYLLATILDLATLNSILGSTWPALIVAIPIVFQPELRRALERIGHTGEWLRTSLPGGDAPELEKTIDEIVRASAQLARQRFGALMVLERETGLQEYADRGVAIDGLVSRQLLINNFFPNSPLHDGAAIIRGSRILAASCVLPLSDNISASSQIGTRHRAALGITEESDALAIVVSEETGNIAVAHNGRLIRNLDQDRLRRVLRTLSGLDREQDNTSATGRLHLPSRARADVKAATAASPEVESNRTSAKQTGD